VRKGVFCVLLSLLICNGAFAVERLNIISFDEDIVEVKEGSRHGKIVDMPIANIGTLPLRVLSTDKVNFHKVIGKEGKELWVSGSYVTLNKKKVKRNCRSVMVARESDVKAFGVRGAGEACKRKR